MKSIDKGIFLHRTSFSESSVIATFYTQKNGFQKFVFQGAKKKNHVLFPLNCCELTYYYRPDSDLLKLTQVDSIVILDDILWNPMKSIVAFFIADVIRQSLQTNEKEEDLFQFLQDLIQALNETNDVASFPLVFLVKFTPWIGIQPHVTNEEVRYFNLIEGEFDSVSQAGDLSVEGELAQAIFRMFQYNEMDAKHRKSAFEVILQYYELHIPRFDVSRSLSILRETLI